MLIMIVKCSPLNTRIEQPFMHFKLQSEGKDVIDFKQDKVNLVKVEILSSCSSKDSFDEHSSSFCWRNNTQSSLDCQNELEDIPNFLQDTYMILGNTEYTKKAP